MRVEIRAQFQQRPETDFYEQIIRDPVDDSPRKLDYDQCETEQGNPCSPIAAYGNARSQEIVHDDLERPRLEQIQANSDERQKQTENRLSPKRLVVPKDALINGHLNFSLRIFVFVVNYGEPIAARPLESPRLRSE